MSQPLSHFLHPFDISRQPRLEPEVERAILARWAADRSAARGERALCKAPGAGHAVPGDDLAASRGLEGQQRAKDAHP